MDVIGAQEIRADQVFCGTALLTDSARLRCRRSALRCQELLRARDVDTRDVDQMWTKRGQGTSLTRTAGPTLGP